MVTRQLQQACHWKINAGSWLSTEIWSSIVWCCMLKFTVLRQLWHLQCTWRGTCWCVDSLREKEMTWANRKPTTRLCCQSIKQCDAVKRCAQGQVETLPHWVDAPQILHVCHVLTVSASALLLLEPAHVIYMFSTWPSRKAFLFPVFSPQTIISERHIAADWLHKSKQSIQLFLHVSCGIRCTVVTTPQPSVA